MLEKNKALMINKQIKTYKNVILKYSSWKIKTM